MPRKTISISVLVALAAVIAAIVGTTAGQAADPTTRTLNLVEATKGATFKIVRNSKAPKSKSKTPEVSIGDGILFTNPVTDSTGAKLGGFSATCDVIKGGVIFKSTWSCSVTYKLTGGSLYAVADFSVSGASTDFAVIGGTGTYANARGTGVSVSQKDESSIDTITLVN
jgi:hypothetical protein